MAPVISSISPVSNLVAKVSPKYSIMSGVEIPFTVTLNDGGTVCTFNDPNTLCVAPLLSILEKDCNLLNEKTALWSIDKTIMRYSMLIKKEGDLIIWIK